MAACRTVFVWKMCAPFTPIAGSGALRESFRLDVALMGLETRVALQQA